jgi:hypothetical protein
MCSIGKDSAVNPAWRKCHVSSILITCFFKRTNNQNGVSEYDTAKRIKIPKKFSDNFERDWDYLMKLTEKEVRHYLPMCVFQLDEENGLDPKTCYYLYDTHGSSVLKKFKSKDPMTVQRIIWGKSLLNMTIKMWSEDIRQGLLLKSEISEELEKMPEWCRKSLYNSLYK